MFRGFFMLLFKKAEQKWWGLGLAKNFPGEKTETKQGETGSLLACFEGFVCRRHFS